MSFYAELTAVYNDIKKLIAMPVLNECNLLKKAYNYGQPGILHITANAATSNQAGNRFVIQKSCKVLGFNFKCNSNDTDRQTEMCFTSTQHKISHFTDKPF